MSQPPRMVADTAASEPGKEMYLQWDGALDDEGHLRQCPACGSKELFVRKVVPQVTAFVLIVMAAAISVAFFAADKVMASIIVLLVVIIVDVLIYFFSPKTLVCYRCRSQYSQLPIALTQKSWDATRGDRHRKEVIGTPREKLHVSRFWSSHNDAKSKTATDTPSSAVSSSPVADVSQSAVHSADTARRNTGDSGG